MSAFADILRRAVEATPGAIGGAFADAQGEMVDSFAKGYDKYDWAILTATYGVVMAQLHAAFGIWHYGGPEFFIAQHRNLGIVVHVVEAGYYAMLDVVVHAVDGGYYALLAVMEPAPLGHALRSLRRAARELHREML